MSSEQKKQIPPPPKFVGGTLGPPKPYSKHYKAYNRIRSQVLAGEYRWGESHAEDAEVWATQHFPEEFYEKAFLPDRKGDPDMKMADVENGELGDPLANSPGVLVSDGLPINSARYGSNDDPSIPTMKEILDTAGSAATKELQTDLTTVTAEAPQSTFASIINSIPALPIPALPIPAGQLPPPQSGQLPPPPQPGASIPPPPDPSGGAQPPPTDPSQAPPPQPDPTAQQGPTQQDPPPATPPNRPPNVFESEAAKNASSGYELPKSKAVWIERLEEMAVYVGNKTPAVDPLAQSQSIIRRLIEQHRSAVEPGLSLDLISQLYHIVHSNFIFYKTQGASYQVDFVVDHADTYLLFASDSPKVAKVDTAHGWIYGSRTFTPEHLQNVEAQLKSNPTLQLDRKSGFIFFTGDIKDFKPKYLITRIDVEHVRNLLNVYRQFLQAFSEDRTAEETSSLTTGGLWEKLGKETSFSFASDALVPTTITTGGLAATAGAFLGKSAAYLALGEIGALVAIVSLLRVGFLTRDIQDSYQLADFNFWSSDIDATTRQRFYRGYISGTLKSFKSYIPFLQTAAASGSAGISLAAINDVLKALNLEPVPSPFVLKAQIFTLNEAMSAVAVAYDAITFSPTPNVVRRVFVSSDGTQYLFRALAGDTFLVAERGYPRVDSKLPKVGEFVNPSYWYEQQFGAKVTPLNTRFTKMGAATVAEEKGISEKFQQRAQRPGDNGGFGASTRNHASAMLLYTTERKSDLGTLAKSAAGIYSVIDTGPDTTPFAGTFPGIIPRSAVDTVLKAKEENLKQDTGQVSDSASKPAASSSTTNTSALQVGPQLASVGLDAVAITKALEREQLQLIKLGKQYYDGHSDSLDPVITSQGPLVKPPSFNPLLRHDGNRAYTGDPLSNPLNEIRLHTQAINEAEELELEQYDAVALVQPPAKLASLYDNGIIRAAAEASRKAVIASFRPQRVKYALQETESTRPVHADPFPHDIANKRLRRLHMPDASHRFDTGGFADAKSWVGYTPQHSLSLPVTSATDTLDVLSYYLGATDASAVKSTVRTSGQRSGAEKEQDSSTSADSSSSSRMAMMFDRSRR